MSSCKETKHYDSVSGISTTSAVKDSMDSMELNRVNIDTVIKDSSVKQ